MTTATAAATATSAASRLHPFQARLDDEASCEPKVELLFYPHHVQDVSKVKTEQKNGNDFFLYPNLPKHQGMYVRAENKFEKYATGRIALELVSVDRPTLKPGWMFTSKTAWLLSWFPSGDVVALPMQALRELLLSNPARHQATTARNPSYLSWSALEDINWLVMQLDDARVLDLRYELGENCEKSSMIRGSARDKRCKADELVELMTQRAQESTPADVSSEQLVEYMRELAPKNRLRTDEAHARMIARLPKSWGL
jgi:hypothetical protein